MPVQDRPRVRAVQLQPRTPLSLHRDEFLRFSGISALVPAQLEIDKAFPRSDRGANASKRVSALMRNRAGSFSVERLMDFLTALGQDVEISVKPARERRGEVYVIA